MHTPVPTASTRHASDDWREDAACRDAPLSLFFGADEIDRRAALAYCRTCPVRTPCLKQALTADEDYGIWGGTDEHDRRRLRRERRAA